MPASAALRAALTDHERDLERLAAELAGVDDPPATAGDATRAAYCRYRRATLTGDAAELEAAAAAVDAGLRRFGPWPDLCLLKANLDFKRHRLADVKRDLDLAPSLRASPEGRLLRADLDFQEGRYEDARRDYEGAVAADRTWDALARLAHFELKLGDVARADELYAEAEDELTAKELRSYAWVELQRGVVDLSRGRYDAAERHYQRAAAAYSGDWLADAHLGELRAAQGRVGEAVALYESVVARAPRPELQQALGDLYALAGEPERARPWHDRALAAYLDSVRRGEVQYYHHLVDFFAKVRRDGAEAVRWAERDLELRRNFSTLGALAWALHLAGRSPEAVDAVAAALASGVRDAHLFRSAAVIYAEAGRPREAEVLRRRADELNPHHPHFHVHR
jgi:tetratricopeptide (TPR) repeat protein